MDLRRSSLTALLCASLAVLPMQPAYACSRAVYFGLEGQTVTGRSMDWLEDMQTNLWIFPQGMERDGGMGEKGFYGKITTNLLPRMREQARQIAGEKGAYFTNLVAAWPGERHQ